ncbi:MAG: hypothetical protein HOV94_16795 [Saccharothrix sp.]|nr:hypothetical protein [Saccharothrix sp.]
MLQADPALIAALGEPERVHTSLTRLGGKDLTEQVTAWTLDRAYDSDLPARCAPPTAPPRQSCA